MTNLEGLWILFAALILFGVCTIVAMMLGALLVWERWFGRTLGKWFLPVQTALGLIGFAISVVAWGFAFVYMTPSGIVERLFRPNPVLVLLLLGYTVPAILAGYVFWHRRSASIPY